MAIIKLKNGSSVSLPEYLALGEPAVSINEDGHPQFYIGMGNDAPIKKISDVHISSNMPPYNSDKVLWFDVFENCFKRFDPNVEDWVIISGTIADNIEISDDEVSETKLWSSNKIQAELNNREIFHVGITSPENINLFWIDTN